MRKFSDKSFIFIVMVSLLIVLAGCGSNQSKENTNQIASNQFVVTDDLKRQVTLTKYPTRIVALSPSFLEVLNEVDAKVIGRPSSKSVVPDRFQAAEEVGAVYHINIEKVVGLQPDLVIAYEGMHDKFVPILEANHIPVIVVRMKTYQDVLDKITLFGQITGNVERSQALAEKMQTKTNEILARIPQAGKRVAILHSTAKSVTVELEGSIAGSTAQMLGFKNIASGSTALESDPDSTPYSLEKLVESNPEIIFVVTMGDLEAIKKQMTEEMKMNPAWNSLAAIQQDKLYFLPQDLFLLNPSLRYPEAVQTMAQCVYPEVANDGK